MPGGLKNGVFHQHRADKERGRAHYCQQHRTRGVAVGVEDVHYRVGEDREPHTHRQADDRGDAHGVLGGLARGGVCALGYRAGYLRDYRYRERRDEGRREIEERLRLAVYAVEYLRLIIGEARGGLETVHAELGVDGVEDGHDACAESDGDADGENVLYDLPRRVDDPIIVRRVVRVVDTGSVGRGQLGVMAALVYYHIQQGNDRADGDAEYRTGGANGLAEAGLEQARGEDQAGDDLEEHFEHFIHRRGDHVAVALTVAAVGGDKAHQQYRRCHGLYAQRRVGVFKVLRGEPFREQEQYQREDDAYHREGR